MRVLLAKNFRLCEYGDDQLIFYDGVSPAVELSFAWFGEK
jgi:hypothetical protein